MLDSIQITAFKKIESANISLSKINVFVGGNNSGKSCILQGLHFGIALSQARRIASADQFPPEQLRYCPTDDFLNLYNRKRLTESNAINFTYATGEGETLEEAKVSLTRGRNGVVKAQVSGGNLLNSISDPKGFFSIYVPGLAGISIREEYRSELVMNNGIARGDANLYLRNLLLRIEREEARKMRFAAHLSRVFPGASVKTVFIEASDLTIRSSVTMLDGQTLPIDMVGTGMLQAIQLIAYVTMYEPKLLLLDEPDAHLHPMNQKLLADVLSVLVTGSETKVLIATHSRHLLDAFSEVDGAKLFWVKDGNPAPQDGWSDVAVLMDLGALDRGERLLNGAYRNLIWTEDQDTRWLEMFAAANGADPDETFIFSYRASSKVDAARLMGEFLQRVRPGVRTIIHRDRDFMSDDEVNRLRGKYNLADSSSMRLFVTRDSDIEAYFCYPKHMHNTFGITEVDARVMIGTAIQENQNEFAITFHTKRNEVKQSLYKADSDACPSAISLLPSGQVPVEKAVGKLLLKKLGPKLQEISQNPSILLARSDALLDVNFSSFLEKKLPNAAPLIS